MADLYFKVPKIEQDMGAGVMLTNSSAATVDDAYLLNFGFNAGITEALVTIFDPSAQVATDVRALAGVTELTQAQYDAEKPNYPN
jgi:hypothetical protein